jgi:hypothetical protein
MSYDPQPVLAPVATAGTYASLTGTPTLGTAAAQPSTAFDAAGLAAAETTRAQAAEAALQIITVSTTYTTGGAIAIADRFSKLKQTSAASYTLAAGTTAGHPITLSNVGSGNASVTVATFNGNANVLFTLSPPTASAPGSIRNLYWDATDSTYYLFS